MKCTVENCTRPIRAKGLCTLHYTRAARGVEGWAAYDSGPRPTQEQIFLSRINKRADTGCWEWTGARHSFGYGQMRRDGKIITAHRWAYDHFVGPITAGMEVCHRCDNPPCCNPSHLFLGTHRDNVNDAVSKNRMAGNGGVMPKRKVTDEQIQAIRASLESSSALAAKYGVGRSAIHQIRTGKSFPDHPGRVVYRDPRKNKLSDSEIAAIVASPESSRVLGKHYGVSKTTILTLKRNHPPVRS